MREFIWLDFDIKVNDGSYNVHAPCGKKTTLTIRILKTTHARTHTQYLSEMKRIGQTERDRQSHHSFPSET